MQSQNYFLSLNVFFAGDLQNVVVDFSLQSWRYIFQMEQEEF
jgi:hypothetical protein